ncbi:MAG: hypothetical protein ACRDJU_02315 [Actinomycetota bacterium]
MSTTGPKPTTIRVRGSRAQLEAVKKTAEAAGLQLAREQGESVSDVARALAQISDHEGIAHIEGRLVFVERQLERLGSRREQSDHLIDSELAVMRARLEDTLRAFAEITQGHENTMATVERGVASIAAEADRRSRSALEGLRVELLGRLDAATRASESLQVQMAAEKQAFEEEAERRSAALTAALAEGRAIIKTAIRTALAEVEEQAASVSKDLGKLDRDGLLAELRQQMDDWLSEPLDDVERLQGELSTAHANAVAEIESLRNELADGLQDSDEKALGAAVHLESMIVQLRRRLVGDESEWSAVVGEAGEAVGGLRRRVEELLGRVCDLEAAGAAGRGSSVAQQESVDRRLDLHEAWARASITEISELGLRCNSMDSRLSSLDEVRALAEQQAGTIEFLKRRIADLEERLLPAGLAAPVPATVAPNGNGHSNGNGNGHANGHASGNSHANRNGSAPPNGNGHANASNGNGHMPDLFVDFDLT